MRNDKVYEYDQYTYSAEGDHQMYLRNRQNSGRRPKWLACDSFTNWVDDMMFKKGWSPYVIINRAMKEKLFSHDLIPCTSTLYHWIDRRIMRTKNIDLLEKVSRKPRNGSPTHRENRRVLSPSIEERLEEVESRKIFRYWEIDTLIGDRAKDDPVLLTLVERKKRFEIMLKIDEQNQPKVDQAMNKLYEQLGNYAEALFRTITSDNGSEFAGIYEVLIGKTDVFFAHSYASYERGTKENQHKLVRRFIPKGNHLKEISIQTINHIEKWMNNYPRKILGYQTVKEAFIKELELLAS